MPETKVESAPETCSSPPQLFHIKSILPSKVLTSRHPPTLAILPRGLHALTFYSKQSGRTGVA
jgi:hypothetical protein